MATDSSRAQRLSRLIHLIPYLSHRPGISLSEAAHDWNTSENELATDVKLLFMCGLPGYGPGDLVEVDITSEGEIYLTYDAEVKNALRLSVEEAVALVMALRSLSELPDFADMETLTTVLVKLETATAGSRSINNQIIVDDSHIGTVMPVIHQALTSNHALDISYYTASRDDVTQRIISPLSVHLGGGIGYLQAWCHQAEAIRRFRLDRIIAVTLTDIDRIVPPANPQSESTGKVENSLPISMIFHLTPAARWVLDYYLCTNITVINQGLTRVTIDVADSEAGVRLALRLVPHATVVEPPEIAERMTSYARQTLSFYQ